MTTDTWAGPVLDEAEAIVFAEWTRLQHHSDRATLIGARVEMPAARSRPPLRTTLIALQRRPDAGPAGDRGAWPIRRRPRSPMWVTQRSPPQPDLSQIGSPRTEVMLSTMTTRGQ